VLRLMLAGILSRNVVGDEVCLLERMLGVMVESLIPAVQEF